MVFSYSSPSWPRQAVYSWKENGSNPPLSSTLLSFSLCVLVAQSYPTLCNSTNRSPPGFSVHGILQARILGWTTIPFSRGSSWSRDWTLVSCTACRFFSVCAIAKSLFSLYSPNNCSIYWASFYVLSFCLFLSVPIAFSTSLCVFSAST